MQSHVHLSVPLPIIHMYIVSLSPNPIHLFIGNSWTPFQLHFIYFHFNLKGLSLIIVCSNLLTGAYLI